MRHSWQCLTKTSQSETTQLEFIQHIHHTWCTLTENSGIISGQKWYTFWGRHSDNLQNSIKETISMSLDWQWGWSVSTIKRLVCSCTKNNGFHKKWTRQFKKQSQESALFLVYFVRPLNMQKQNGSSNFWTKRMLPSSSTITKILMNF